MKRNRAPLPMPTAINGEPTMIEGRLRRRFSPERARWQKAAQEGYDAGGPYLMAHPYREIAEELVGVGYCPACAETYNPGLVDWHPSPGILAARRWVLRHNLERHPRRARRASH